MEMHRLQAVVGIGLLALGLAACQSKPTPDLRPPNPKIDSSFSMKPGLSRTSGANVCIQHTALEKHFMIFSQARSSETAGQWMLFEPQIIFFKRSGLQMGVFEANLARVYDDIVSEKLIQTFTVTSEDSDSVCFDWSYGLQTVVVKESPGTTDPEVARQLMAGRAPIAKVIASFVDEARIENNQLHFRQMTRLRQSVLRLAGKIESKMVVGAGQMTEQDTAVTLEMRIRPYVPNKNFPVLKSMLDRGYGYFTNYTIAPGTGQPFEVAQRWDTAKGLIKFRLSSSIPLDLVPAVTQGLEYWNRVAGRPILEVIPNVDPKAPMEEHSVMVHWVDWKDAGFAYAGFQADPLTGEILQGQIFLTSSWRTHGEYYEQLGGSMSSLLVAAPEGARPQPGCRYHHDAFAAWEHLPMVAQAKSGDDSPLHLIIKSVVAHEAGHVVGLRHNFAASFYSGKSAEELAEKTRRFVQDGAIEPLATITSVMDYPHPSDDLMASKHISTEVLDWDKKAFHWGYTDHTVRERLDFCTDEDLGKFIGCAQGDSSTNPVAAEINWSYVTRARGAWADHGTIMQTIFPNHRDRNDVEDVLNAVSTMNPQGPSAGLLVLDKLNALFSSTDLKIHSVAALMDWENPGRVEKLKVEALEKMRGEVGLLRALDLAFPWDSVNNLPDQKFWERQLTSIRTNPKFMTGNTKGGVPYALSEKEADRVAAFMAFKAKDASTLAFTSFAAFLPGPKLKFNPSAKTISSRETIFQESAALKADLPKIAERMLAIMKASTDIQVFTVGGVTISVPVRIYDPRLFSSWARLFQVKFNKNATPAQSPEIATILKRDLTPVFATIGVASPETVSVDELKTKKAAAEAGWPLELRTWVDGELARIEDFEKS